MTDAACLGRMVAGAVTARIFLEAVAFFGGWNIVRALWNQPLPKNLLLF